MYIDGANPSFIKSLKLQIGEDADYDKVIAIYRSEGLGDDATKDMKIVPAIFVSSLVLNQNQTAIAQQQQQQQQEQALASKGISFEIDNVTFSHHMASVNGVQLQYVIGNHGDPLTSLIFPCM